MPYRSARLRPFFVLLALVGISGGRGPYVTARELQSAAPVSRDAAAAASASDVLDKYCVSCHNGRLKTAGLEIDRLDASRVADAAAQWEKIVTKLRTGEMPPQGRPRPDAATYRLVADTLERRLDEWAAAHPHPGRVPVHRLNRSEYANAVRDLLGLEIDARALLSSDEADQEGFDNVASVLSVSPALLENYLTAARKISRLAVGDPGLRPIVETFKISKALVQDDRLGDLPFGSQGGALIRHQFPLDAEYTIKVLLRRQEYDYIIGMGEPHQLDVRIDGVRVKRFNVGGEAKGMTAPENFAGNTQGDPEFEEYLHTADARLEVRVPVKAGLHEVGVSFVRRFWQPEGVLQPPQTGFGRTTNEYYHGNPAVEFVMIGGPYGPLDGPNRQSCAGCNESESGRIAVQGARSAPREEADQPTATRKSKEPLAASPAPGDSPSRRTIFTCRPKDAAAEEPCARKILSTIAARAYRRPLAESDVQTLLGFFRSGRTEDGFDAGIQRGIERILAAPSFLFRIEREPPGLAAGAAYRLTDLELASRLAFFLWGTIPDDELRDVAARGKLSDPVALEQQVQRMLRDQRSKALVDNFATRWLELSKLSGAVPDTELYSEFDENLREAMEQETKLFIASQLRENRSVVDLLTADYSFLNERLATHYGIRNVYGNHFRRVTFTDGTRGGLLGHASLLTVTSYPNRTSVTIRGRWLLANLLGAPPPPPPPDIPALKDAGVDGQPRSLRERMEVHRKNPSCASCHQRMDPLGFALENFDAVGKWRTSSDGAAIDASATFPDGTRFEGAAGLRALIVSHKEEFVRTLGAKLLAYAVGRGLDHHDMPVVRKVARDAEAAGYSWSSVVTAIVRSAPFSMAVASGEPARATDADSRAGKARQ
jgi:mono/diheme cytochrome c family protein